MIPLRGSLPFLRYFLYLWSMHFLCEKKGNGKKFYSYWKLIWTSIFFWHGIVFFIPQLAWKGSLNQTYIGSGRAATDEGLNLSASRFHGSVRGGEKDKKVRSDESEGWNGDWHIILSSQYDQAKTKKVNKGNEKNTRIKHKSMNH